MQADTIQVKNIKGLSQSQVELLRHQYGKNVMETADDHRILRIIAGIVREPMFILLVIACSLYFILGNNAEGIMMAVAMIIVTAISFYQEAKSSRALKSLQQFTEPRVTVIRDGKEQVVRNEELVPGDIILLEEGMKIPADAIVLKENDLSVNESVVTGESVAVEKNETENNNKLYLGTTIESGKCIAEVIATGSHTVVGKIGKAVSAYNPGRTFLQIQVNRFVKRFAFAGIIAFAIIFFVNYIHYREFVTSLLFALTLAMSVAPEEIPVAFSSFMALGAYKMSRFGIISRQPQIIENLGAVTVICLDKTGTITENKMVVKSVYDYKHDHVIDVTEQLQNNTVLVYSMLASESNPFDSMEKAIWEAYQYHKNSNDYENLKMVHEYPLEGKPPMMTHIYQGGNEVIVAAKGAPERIFSVCKIPDETKNKLNRIIQHFASQGYRVLGVASATHTQPAFPVSQNDFEWQLEGLIVLYDPPKKNSAAILQQLSAAGIQIKLITGDHPETAVAIGQQVGIPDSLFFYTGDEVMSMKEDELSKAVKSTTIFARMFPDAKLKVINALKSGGEIVAMTGDGINDGPALKAADIGIAMGKKGTDIARQASDLVITDDNLEKIAVAIREGRKIFSNLVKAIRYIISIHTPIILTASLPLILGWSYPNIFTPVHVIFLELIMGPTCSIFFEKEPTENNVMLSGPRNRKISLFTRNEFLISIVQGFAITTGVLLLYYRHMKTGHSIEETRTMVFTALILSNLFLTFSNRSFTRTIFHTMRYKNILVPFIIVISAIFLLLLQFNDGARHIFQLGSISGNEFWLCFVTAFASVMWFEVYKMIRYKTL